MNTTINATISTTINSIISHYETLQYILKQHREPSCR